MLTLLTVRAKVWHFHGGNKRLPEVQLLSCKKPQKLYQIEKQDQQSSLARVSPNNLVQTQNPDGNGPRSVAFCFPQSWN